jgi:hypothetical protein
MFHSKTVYLLFIAFALKTVLSSEVETENSTTTTEVSLLEGKLRNDDIAISELDLPKNDSASGNTNIRRWAPYPQDLTSGANPQSGFPSAANPTPRPSNAGQQSPNFQPQSIGSSVPGIWNQDFWNSLPFATPTENTNQSKRNFNF